MTVRLDVDIIRLEGDCHVEQAEALVQLLQDDRRRTVDLTGCQRVHAALVQALLAFKPKIQGAPADPFLRDHLMPCLTLPPPEDEPHGQD